MNDTDNCRINTNGTLMNRVKTFLIQHGVFSYAVFML